MLTGKEMAKLAVDFSAGSVTAAWIKQTYGDNMLSAIVALAAGGLAGIATDKALDVLDEHTGVVSAVGDVIDAGFALGGWW